MTSKVWVLDTTWSNADLKARGKRFPNLQHVYKKAKITAWIKKLAKNPGAIGPDEFWFVHQSDVNEVAHLLDPLRHVDTIRLFSGASAGVHDDILPRNLVQRQLDDFLSYWFNGDRQSALATLTSRPWWIDRLQIWSDRVQHDYINLLAPIDLLALALVSGEIEQRRYAALRQELLDRLRNAQREFLAHKRVNLRGMANVFDEIVELVETSDPSQKGVPTPLPTEERIAACLDARILHVDDEIDKGWDLVMRELFGHSYEFLTDPDAVLPNIRRLEKTGEPYIVLLDLGLRSGDSPVPKAWRGIDLLKQIRASFPTVPVLVLSARQDLSSYRQVIEAGANGFITKPCRAISSVADAELFAGLRLELLNTRFDIFRDFTYKAFAAFLQELETGAAKPFYDPNDQYWNKRKTNLTLALDQLLKTDFERCVRDENYANVEIRNLILAFFRPLEKPSYHDDAGTKPETHWKYLLAKNYRNLCAHHGRGQTLANLDVRDVFLVALLLLDSDALGSPVSSTVRNHLYTAYDVLFIAIKPPQLRNLWREANDPANKRYGLERFIQNITPVAAFDNHDNSDPRLLGLIAEKIIRPRFSDQQIMFLNTPSSVELGPWTPLLASIELQETAQHSASAQSVDTHRIHAEANAVQQRKTWTKGMDHFFAIDGGDMVIRLGQRYAGVRVDGSATDQRQFFAWYFDEHIRANPKRYSDEVLEFLLRTYGVGFDEHSGQSTRADVVGPSSKQPVPTDVSADTQRPPTTRPTRVLETSSAPSFHIALYRIGDQGNPNSAEAAVRTLVRELPGATVDQSRPAVVLFEDFESQRPHLPRRGVRFRLRQRFKEQGAYLQISPTLESGDREEFRSLPLLSYADAEELISKAAQALPWIESSPLGSSYLSRSGLYPAITQNKRLAEPSRLTKLFKGKSIGVANEAGDVARHARASWEQALSRSSGATICTPEQSDCIVVIIPVDCPLGTLQKVHERWSGFSRPWKVVTPNHQNKDWNVLVGLASRFGAALGPLAPYRPRDRNTFYIGLDLGHEAGQGSILAGSILDSQGCLRGWTTVPNPGTPFQTTAERINKGSFEKAMRALLSGIGQENTNSIRRLVIHRDGRTLEDVDDFLELLRYDSKIQQIDWIDIDKRGAPPFFLDSHQPSGHFACFDDHNGQTEMWLRTTAGAHSRYTRPLRLLQHTADSDLETLGLEVFDLSNGLSQDYETKTRLPLTTYYADGFSATGQKRVKFWGYEHLYRNHH